VTRESTPASDHYDLSFVIPCLNEEAHIGQTLQDILRFTPEHFMVQVIVADHGSSDRTREIAAALGAHVVCHPDVTLGDLRNWGARIAMGNILIFLDADVSLTKDWHDNISAGIRALQSGERLILGSRTEYAYSEHWTHRGYGLQATIQGDVPYLGTAHLIITKALFDHIGGFPSDRDTGEDEVFGQRARQLGVRLAADPRLRAIHRGAPATATEFFLRQLWHGLGDVTSVARLIRSPTAIAGLAFVGANLLALSATPPLRLVSPVVAGSALLAALGIVTLKVWTHRHRLRAPDLGAAFATFSLFFLARGVAFFAQLFMPRGRRINSRRVVARPDQPNDTHTVAGRADGS
jgi:hypothetical protein